METSIHLTNPICPQKSKLKVGYFKNHGEKYGYYGNKIEKDGYLYRNLK